MPAMAAGAGKSCMPEVPFKRSEINDGFWVDLRGLMTSALLTRITFAWAIAAIEKPSNETAKLPSAR